MQVADLVGRGVVDSCIHRVVVEDVELFAVVCPRDELDVAVLRVERKILDVERAVGFDERRVHPQYRSVTRYDRVRHHVLIKLVTGATSTIVPPLLLIMIAMTACEQSRGWLFTYSSCSTHCSWFLARDAFVRTNRRAIAMMFVPLPVWDGRAL